MKSLAGPSKEESTLSETHEKQEVVLKSKDLSIFATQSSMVINQATAFLFCSEKETQDSKTCLSDFLLITNTEGTSLSILTRTSNRIAITGLPRAKKLKLIHMQWKGQQLPRRIVC